MTRVTLQLLPNKITSIDQMPIEKNECKGVLLLEFVVYKSGTTVNSYNMFAYILIYLHINGVRKQNNISFLFFNSNLPIINRRPTGTIYNCVRHNLEK